MQDFVGEFLIYILFLNLLFLTLYDLFLHMNLYNILSNCILQISKLLKRRIHKQPKKSFSLAEQPKMLLVIGIYTIPSK